MSWRAETGKERHAESCVCVCIGMRASNAAAFISRPLQSSNSPSPSPSPSLPPLSLLPSHLLLTQLSSCDFRHSSSTLSTITSICIPRTVRRAHNVHMCAPAQSPVCVHTQGIQGTERTQQVKYLRPVRVCVNARAHVQPPLAVAACGHLECRKPASASATSQNQTPQP